MTGQDATLQGVQNIVNGDQCMTVYKAIKKEADAAADLAIALAKGEKPTASTTPVNNEKKDVPSVLLDPVSVTKDNISDYTSEPDFPKVEEICAGKVAAAVQGDRPAVENGPGAPRPGRPGPLSAERSCQNVTDDTPVLELQGVSKSFGAVQALFEVDFHVSSGEVMALVGDNGAGKSTLIKCIAGIHPITSGEIRFEGQPVNIHGPKDAARLGIEVVYQDLALADNLDVVQNMYLGRELVDGLHRLDETTMEAKARETLRGLSVTTISTVRQLVASLSGGQRQSVAVAKAVMWNSKVVILDEPTAALGVAQTRQVLDLVKRLGEQGLGVILISHNLSDVFEVADSITVLRLGQNVAEYKRTETNQQQVVEAITAGKLSKVPGQEVVA